ncbi:MAG: tRNA (adenosine(37)-N6)-threonylcarbamoyltransferase complex transferase subunit TsaD [Cyclobacteriaceae bacterium]|nr:tRNA (adenosine(37)-N6)-threonylcarbamoyltransferase complex transferase subunit TsaD [Cyclobacteriaceae bacterium]MCX7636795.1 tRNA (adenosine(37)-N6)-threonylcarbamoyltransferase complex transferase subunit TsaD [Cyclobacteriaceae bacterium]MDW8331314.1 tRNA (adenosine(37)-N6)-threonylcarbamoyltransferase complex transferase subunit TsaD [Cyclobacteriaceae bacterium]
MSPLILAIESSCDETSASVIRNGKVLNNIIASQEVHQKYGGVVPELASRAHQRSIWHTVDEAVRTAGIKLDELHAVAFTRGPGLMGSLLVGASFAKGLALALDIPLIGINHMEAHVLSNFIEEPVPSFPFLCLTVSGGHTQLIKVSDYLEMEILGETQDDAVGEAFDKAAKLLGLPYPGGPLIDRYAQSGNPHRFNFPKTEMPGLHFSFSGIKTAFLYFIRENILHNPDFVKENLPDICASLQYHLVNMLTSRLQEAAQQTGIKEIALAGGVAANSGLRQALHKLAGQHQWKVYLPAMQYCTDNAAMIAMAAHYKYLKGIFEPPDTVPLARYPVGI